MKYQRISNNIFFSSTLHASILFLLLGVDHASGYSIDTTVAIAALTAVGGVCAMAAFPSCLVASVTALAITILSGFQDGKKSSDGKPISERDVSALIQRVEHHHPNGTMVHGLQ